MTFSRNILLAIIALVFCSTATADIEAVKTDVEGCWVVDLCTGEEAGDGDCEFTAGGEILVFKAPGNRLWITLNADDSAASVFTCYLMKGSQGHDDTAVPVQITLTAVTASQRSVSITGPPGIYWARCAGTVTGTHTMTGEFCPSN